MKWLFDLGRRRRINREVAEEVESHIEEKVAELVERGVPSQEARRHASREFGNATLVTERSREAWGWTALERIAQDVRHGLRILRRSPWFTAIVVLSLALGIGANTAIFSVIDGLMLKMLTVRDPEQLVRIQGDTFLEFLKLHVTFDIFPRADQQLA